MIFKGVHSCWVLDSWLFNVVLEEICRRVWNVIAALCERILYMMIFFLWMMIVYHYMMILLRYMMILLHYMMILFHYMMILFYFMMILCIIWWYFFIIWWYFFGLNSSVSLPYTLIPVIKKMAQNMKEILEELNLHALIPQFERERGSI